MELAEIMPPSLAPQWHPAIALLPEAPTREQIEAFGARLQELEGDAGPCDAVRTNVIVHGELYGRVVQLDAETFLVGLAHTEPGLAVSVGDITVWTEEGRKRLTGAHILPTTPGRMRIGFAHAPTAWFTVHPNKTGSMDERTIEDALVANPERLMTRRAAQ